MLKGLAIILGFQLMGEAIVSGLQLPFPGPVVGLLLLWVALERGWVYLQAVETAARLLLEHLVLFFVPVVVGAMVYIDLFARHWLALGLGIGLSTMIGLLVTGKVASYWQKSSIDDALSRSSADLSRTSADNGTEAGDMERLFSRGETINDV